MIASNVLVVEAHGLEYRTLGRLTQTFTVCIEEAVDKEKEVYSRKYINLITPVGHKTLSEDARIRFIN